MLKLTRLLILLAAAQVFVACGETSAENDTNTKSSDNVIDVTEKTESNNNIPPAPAPLTFSDNGKPTKITWEHLVPESYSAAAIMEKYQDDLDKIQDGTPESMVLFEKITQELNSAPLNEKIGNKRIKLPGFIAPLNQQNGLITEFLLVPYFGACIHAPPPPVNQTVMVTTDTKNAIKAENAFEPIWVTGEINLDGKVTDIGQAGYTINKARIEEYTDER